MALRSPNSRGGNEMEIVRHSLDFNYRHPASARRRRPAYTNPRGSRGPVCTASVSAIKAEPRQHRVAVQRVLYAISSILTSRFSRSER